MLFWASNLKIKSFCSSYFDFISSSFLNLCFSISFFISSIFYSFSVCKACYYFAFAFDICLSYKTLHFFISSNHNFWYCSWHSSVYWSLSSWSYSSFYLTLSLRSVMFIESAIPIFLKSLTTETNSESSNIEEFYKLIGLLLGLRGKDDICD